MEHETSTEQVQAQLQAQLRANLAQLRARIATAAQRAGRSADEVTLVAVSKGHPPESIAVAHELGLRDFGENRVGELLDKRESLLLPELEWHFIGNLQRRKVKQLVTRCGLVHSIDRLSLAQELSKRADEAVWCFDGLLQVNSSGEASKSGWEIYHAAGREQLLADVAAMLELPALRLHGLMTMAPFFDPDDAERARPFFAAMRTMQQTLQHTFPNHAWPILSMGMTNDFEVAVEEGATHIRVGTALFGARDYTE